MTAQNAQNETDLELQLDTDDSAFDDAAMSDDMPRATERRKSPMAKMLAGVAVIALLLGGGWYAYQNFMAPPAPAPMAGAMPADVPADGTQTAGMPADPMAQPMDPMAQQMDPAAMPQIDPMAAGMPADPNAMMAQDGMPPSPPVPPEGVVDPAAMPADQMGMPMDQMAQPSDQMAQPSDQMPQPMDPMAAGSMEGAAPAIDPMTGLPMIDNAAAMPDAMTPPADAAASPDAMAGAMPDAMGAAPLDQPAGADPAIAQPVMEQPAMEQPAADHVMHVPAQDDIAAAAPVTPETMPVADAPAINAAANAELKQQVSTLENRIAQLEGEIATLRERGAAAPAADSGVSQADFDALSRRIDELTRAQETRVAAPAPAMDETPARSTNTLAPNPMPKLAVPGLRRTTTSTTTVKTMAPAPAPAKNWQLRSAQPGRAWIAESGTQEMRSVGTGDTVPGLGRILSITQDSTGKWTITGTTGTVRQ